MGENGPEQLTSRIICSTHLDAQVGRTQLRGPPKRAPQELVRRVTTRQNRFMMKIS